MIERLKTLYKNKTISNDAILEAVGKGWITVEEAVGIIGEDSALEVVCAIKLKELSKSCNETIVAGIDVETTNGIHHFNLSIEDQSNINNLFKVIELGATEYPYQADNGICTIYSAKEIADIYLSAQSLIAEQLMYHNGLKEYVKTLDDVKTILKVAYGMKLPKPFNSELKSKLAVVQSQMQSIVAKYM